MSTGNILFFLSLSTRSYGVKKMDFPAGQNAFSSVFARSTKTFHRPLLSTRTRGLSEEMRGDGEGWGRGQKVLGVRGGRRGRGKVVRVMGKGKEAKVEEALSGWMVKTADFGGGGRNNKLCHYEALSTTVVAPRHWRIERTAVGFFFFFFDAGIDTFGNWG